MQEPAMALRASKRRSRFMPALAEPFRLQKRVRGAHDWNRRPSGRKQPRKQVAPTVMLEKCTKNSSPLLRRGRSHQPLRRFRGTPSPSNSAIVFKKQALARLEISLVSCWRLSKRRCGDRPMVDKRAMPPPSKRSLRTALLALIRGPTERYFAPNAMA